MRRLSHWVKPPRYKRRWASDGRYVSCADHGGDRVGARLTALGGSIEVTQNYVYANLAVEGKGFMVIRLWKERINHPEVVCYTDTFTNTEMISTALNASVGLTDEQAEALTQEWVAAAC